VRSSWGSVTSGVSPPGERRSDWWLTTMISSQLAGPFIPGEQRLSHVVELFGELSMQQLM
jgi:hypothetical protein